MDNFLVKELHTYIEISMAEYHQSKVDNINKLVLIDILRNKDFEFFQSINLKTSEQIINRCIEHRIYLCEKHLFEHLMMDLAIFTNRKVYGGWKSGIQGIDLEFDKDGCRYIVAIKSGPNWANRSQLEKMKTDFISAKRTLRTSNSKVNIIAVNGCCYGRENNPDRGDYYKYCGQVFWTFISGDENLYTELIEPLGFNAKLKNDEYLELYSNLINRFTTEFSTQFCSANGSINWEKLVKFNSGKEKEI